MESQRKGMLLVVSGPSGVGKGTLLDRLMQDDPTFGFSVSATTRAPRDYEIPEVHYHFLTEEAFDRLLGEDAFLEHAAVHGHRYGTLRSEVEQRLRQGRNVLLDIDTQGALNVMAQAPECVSVFILPPTFEALRQRLRGYARFLSFRGEPALDADGVRMRFTRSLPANELEAAQTLRTLEGMLPREELEQRALRIG